MNTHAFQDLLLIFATSVFATAFCGRIGIAPILGYLFVGVAFGPSAIGVLENVDEIHDIAEFGIVFLLFTLGLEFSIPKMLALRRAVFGIGFMQVLLTGLLIFGAARSLDVDYKEAMLLAGVLSLSSTAIVTKELMRRRELNRHHGQVAFGVLLFQDIAAIIFILLISLSSGPSTIDFSRAATDLIFRAFFLFGSLLTIVRWILPRVFHEVGRAGGEELLLLTALVVALAAGWVTHLAGLPMSLGAFLAGMTLGESHYRHQIEADIRPFRDVLLGLFFVGVGALLDASSLLDRVPELFAVVLGLWVLKSGLLFVIARWMGESPRHAILVGFMLAPAGEFGFVLLTMAYQAGTISSVSLSFFEEVIIVSMLTTPLSIWAGQSLAALRARRARQIEEAGLPLPESVAMAMAGLKGHVVICGYGRVGQTVSRFLQRFKIPFVALDNDPMRVREAVEAGESVFFGDSTRIELLRALAVDRARLVVIGFSDDEHRIRTLQTVRTLDPNLPVLVRTSDDSQLQQYLDLGATEVVPETLEASLMLVANVLTLVDVPMPQILRAIMQARQERYRILKGYYLGLHSRLIDDEGKRLKILHAVPVTGEAFAAGRRIADLGLAELEVEVQAIRREGHSEQSPAMDTCLLLGDIVVLFGEPEMIEAGERRLLNGP